MWKFIDVVQFVMLTMLKIFSTIAKSYINIKQATSLRHKLRYVIEIKQNILRMSRFLVCKTLTMLKQAKPWECLLTY